MNQRTIFTNARVIGANSNVQAYHRQVVQRGHKDFVMSQGELKEFSRCPHRWVCGYKRKDSPSTDWGSLMDELLLGRGIDAVAIQPEFYPSTSGKKKDAEPEMKPFTAQSNWCKAWIAEQKSNGKTAVSRRDMDDAEAAITGLRNDESIAELLDGAMKQVEVRAEYVDPETGIKIPVKCLIDLVPNSGQKFHDSLADFKTSRSGGIRMFGRFVHGFGYHTQAGFYIDLWNAATDQKRTTWNLFGCESERPYEPFKRTLSQEFIELGRASYRTALRRYARCLATSTWPGYDHAAPAQFNGFTLTEPEPWMMNPEDVYDISEPAETDTNHDPDDVTP